MSDVCVLYPFFFPYISGPVCCPGGSSMERRAIGAMPWFPKHIGAFSMGKSWENHGKMMGKWRLAGNIMELQNPPI